MSETNKWEGAFETFNEENFLKKLNDKVKDKTYREKNKSWVLFIKLCSYVFNLSSGAAAAYACYWLGEKVFGSPYASFAVSIVFLVLFEVAKRKTSGEFWQVAWFKRRIAYGWGIASLLLLFVSIGSSSFGVKQGANNMSPSVELVKSDQRLKTYQKRIKDLEDKNKLLEKQTDHKGKILYRVLPSIKENNKQIAELNQNVIRLENKLEGKNDKLTEEYAMDVDLAGWIAVGLTLLFELLFELCMCYIWFYYHRVYLEFKAIGAFKEETEVRKAPKIITKEIKYVEEQEEEKKFKELSVDKKEISVLDRVQDNKRRIGFFSRIVTPTPLDKTVPEKAAPLSRQEKEQKTGTKSNKQKRTIKHIDKRTGKYKYYTVADVNSFIRKYKKRVNEARRKGNVNLTESREKTLSYWEGRRKELIQ